MKYIGIDPSTKTGFVVLDEAGRVLEAKEITKPGKDPSRMFFMINAIINDVIKHKNQKLILAIEGFGYASQQAIHLGGIGWGIRMKLFENDIDYIDVAPAQLKKFTGAKGNAKKDILAVEIFKRWRFESKSDNIRDAYVLAQIARAMNNKTGIAKFQSEIVESINKKVS